MSGSQTPGVVVAGSILNQFMADTEKKITRYSKDKVLSQAV